MILQALCAYYDRLAANPDSGVSLPGYASAPVGTCIVLNRAGEVVACQPLNEQSGKKTVPLRLIVPQPPKTAGSAPLPSFLCVNKKFLFGIYKTPEGAAYRFQSCAQHHHAILDGVDDDGARAVLAFLDARVMGQYGKADESMFGKGGSIVFRLQGEANYLHERPAIQRAWAAYRAGETEKAEIGQCLITGQVGPIVRLHPNFSGFGQNKPSIVSFNQKAFESHGKEQGANAPVSEDAAFRYGTALNHLLLDARHCIQLNDDKVVFWAERDARQEEALLGALFSGFSPETEVRASLDEEQSLRIRGTLLSLMTGKRPASLSLNEDVRFYILGVSANKTRLVVRFFYRDTFGELVKRMLQHYADTALIGARPQYPSLYYLLRESALQGKRENIAPNLPGNVLRAILTGRQYPSALYAAMLRRIRAEAAQGNSINSTRAGLLRGYLNRGARLQNRKEQIHMELDETRLDKAYLLGRLFAVLEAAQKDALGRDINATIVDKYLNAAMATPQMVFPALIKLFEKHVSKSKREGRKILAAKILSQIDAFPRTLDMRAQSEFILGYYHQRQAFYTPKTKREAQTDTEDNITEDIIKEEHSND